MIWKIEDLNSSQKEYEPGKWGPAKPLGYPGDGFIGRLKGAWAVFTGRAAAVKWY